MNKLEHAPINEQRQEVLEDKIELLKPPILTLVQRHGTLVLVFAEQAAFFYRVEFGLEHVENNQFKLKDSLSEVGKKIPQGVRERYPEIMKRLYRGIKYLLKRHGYALSNEYSRIEWAKQTTLHPLS